MKLIEIWNKWVSDIKESDNKPLEDKIKDLNKQLKVVTKYRTY